MSDIQRGRYRHYKGKLYEVIGLAKHSETEEDYVVYRALYGNRELWIRPKEMFIEIIAVGDKEIQRFEYIGTDRKDDEKLEGH